MKSREDRRIRLTKCMLKDALVDLLNEKDIYHVSVRELCSRADVNRTTFYKYYGNQFELLSDIENDYIEFLKSTFENSNNSPEKLLEEICRYLESNIKFSRLVVSNNIDPSFPQKIFSLAYVKNFSTRKLAAKDGQYEEYTHNFVIYGTFRIISMWLNKEDREPPEVIAALIEQLVK